MASVFVAPTTTSPSPTAPLTRERYILVPSRTLSNVCIMTIYKNSLFSLTLCVCVVSRRYPSNKYKVWKFSKYIFSESCASGKLQVSKMLFWISLCVCMFAKQHSHLILVLITELFSLLFFVLFSIGSEYVMYNGASTSFFIYFVQNMFA